MARRDLAVEGRVVPANVTDLASAATTHGRDGRVTSSNSRIGVAALRVHLR